MVLNVIDEHAILNRVIVGLGAPYQRDKDKVAGEMQEFPFLPNTEWREQILRLEYPTEQGLIAEFDAYVTALERHGVEVLRADPAAAYSFDYTCPRDIGIVIGKQFFVSNMAVQSRCDEFRTIEHHLADIAPERIIRFPKDATIEGGDVILLDDRQVLVGINQRTNRAGFEYLKDILSPLGINTVPVPHSQLHLDCCVNPLGLGHLLIHPPSLSGCGEELWNALNTWQWIEVNDDEREHLATNVLSIKPDTIIARNSQHCRKTNAALAAAGYHLEQVVFDGTPAVGGSFRCASLPLVRQ